MEELELRVEWRLPPGGKPGRVAGVLAEVGLQRGYTEGYEGDEGLPRVVEGSGGQYRGQGG